MEKHSFYYPPQSAHAPNSVPPFQSQYPPPSARIQYETNYIPGLQYPPPSTPIHVDNYVPGSQYPPQTAPIHVTNHIPGPQYSPSSTPPIHVDNYIPLPQHAHPSASMLPIANTVPGPQYAHSSAPIPVAIPFPIIGPQFCSPYPIDLAITRKVLNITDGNFVVTDVNGNFMFKVKDPLFSLHDRRVILDATGKPIVNLRQKIMTAHNRWEVFRGERSEPRDLIFTAKTSRMIQLKTKLDVFLAHNKAQLVCDYKVKGSWLERSCIVYAGESSSIVAQMHKKMSVQSVVLGKDKFMLTVYPNIDFAFIVALTVILDDTNSDD